MKISGFLVGLVLVSILIVSLTGFYFGAASTYGVTYDSSEFAAYEDLGTLQNMNANLSDTVDNAASDNPLDLIGSFLKNGYQAIKYSKAGYAMFTTISEDAAQKVGDAGLGGEGFAHIKTALLMIVFLMFMFAIISVLVNKDV